MKKRLSGFIILVSLSAFVCMMTYGGLLDKFSLSILKESTVRQLQVFGFTRNTRTRYLSRNDQAKPQVSEQMPTSKTSDYLVTKDSSSIKMVDQNNWAMKVDSEAKQAYSGMTTKLKSRIWQACDDQRDVFVYSAYYREVEQDVTVVGIALLEKQRDVTCTFPDRPDMKDVNASVIFIPEDHGMQSAAVFFRCPLTKQSGKPESVGIRVGENVALLRVLYPKPREFNFTVCVACLFGPYKEYPRLIEMIETDLMFGADHFLIYNYSISIEVDKILRYYIEKGKIEVLPWTPPTPAVHYYGQMAQIQDCILSSRGRSRYVVLKDLDELIVPYKHNNWLELMNFLDTGNEKISTFLFQNGFFEFHWKPLIPPNPGSLQIHSLMYIWRNEMMHEIRDRSKAIVKPEFIQAQGIHFNWWGKIGYTTHYVDPAVAYLHHYRMYDQGKSRVTDTRMLDFTDVLVQNIYKTYMELGLKI